MSHVKYDIDTKVIDEMGLCQGSHKIDIAVINGSLIGYEIKSEEDTLYRLPSQMEAYNKVFDYINIVVNENHLQAVKDKIPHFWGIICVKKFGQEFKLEHERDAEKNQASDPFFVSQLLWKDEALDVLRKEGIDKGMKSKSRLQIWKKIAESLPKERINQYVRQYIKNRSTWRTPDLPQL